MALPVLLILGKLLLGGVAAAAGTAVVVAVVVTLAELITQVKARISQLRARRSLKHDNPYVEITEILSKRLQEGRPVRTVNIGLRDVAFLGGAGALRDEFTLEGSELDAGINRLLGNQRHAMTRANTLKMLA